LLEKIREPLQEVHDAAPRDVVEFQAARIILATNHTSRRIGSKAFKPRLTPAFLFQVFLIHSISSR
jgi:hypothetical protein